MVHGLLIVAASLAAEHRPQGVQASIVVAAWAQYLWLSGLWDLPKVVSDSL